MVKYIFTALLAFSTLSVSARSLTRAQAAELKTSLVAEWKAWAKERYAESWKTGVLKHDTLRMPLYATFYGKASEGGRSLWISLHGGGNTPSYVNDEQWDNQKVLYRPSEGMYVAPRAAVDDWDMHCKDFTDALYKQLIQMAVAFEDINPDRVYIMGYSAGGDGVWRLAPRLADHWAAASMMAGHPGNVSLLNLRNTPFSIWCGARDAAYDRNKLDAERGVQLDSLQAADPEGYKHECHIVEGMGHWMNRVDTAAVGWMAQYERNPYPQKVVWRQEEVTQPAFYWLSVKDHERVWGNTVRAEIDGQVIHITECDYTELTLWLNDQMLNLDKKVEVRYKGKTLFKGKVKRTEANMRESLAQRGDIRYIFPAKIEIRVL